MTIFFLSPSDIEKIAAGEIIEGPNVVVKELVENSIDSGAENISVNICKDYIRVKDDGCGIKSEDIEKCIQRYATSKFVSLGAINSLGFRGEGLFAIASVSETIITSRTSDSPMAVRITAEYGEIKKKEDTGASKGTIVEVRDLFGNLPGRKKFFHDGNLETVKIEDTIKRLALCYPGVSFSYSSPRKTLNYVKTTGYLDRINYIQSQEDFFCHKGYTADFSFEIYLEQSPRPASAFYFTAINNRPTYIREIHKAISSTINSIISKSLSYFLYIHTEPHNIDVNIHPTKSIMKFLYMESLIKKLKKVIENFYKPLNLASVAQQGILDINEKIIQRIKKSSLPGEDDNFTEFLNGFQSNNHGELSKMNDSCDFEKAFTLEINRQGDTYCRDEYDYYNPPTIPSRIPYRKATPKGFGEVKCQLFNSIIVSETDTGIYLIDQHAAHERIIYEKMRRNHSLSSQMLIEQETIMVNDEQRSLLEVNEEAIKKVGLDYTFVDNNLVIFSIPVVNNPISDITGFVHDVLDTLVNNHCVIETFFKEIACKLSVKANRPLSIAQMEEITAELAKTEFSNLCNHGRNAFSFTPKEDIMKLFDR